MAQLTQQRLRKGSTRRARRPSLTHHEIPIIATICMEGVFPVADRAFIMEAVDLASPSGAFLIRRACSPVHGMFAALRAMCCRSVQWPTTRVSSDQRAMPWWATFSNHSGFLHALPNDHRLHVQEPAKYLLECEGHLGPILRDLPLACGTRLPPQSSATLSVRPWRCGWVCIQARRTQRQRARALRVVFATMVYHGVQAR